MREVAVVSMVLMALAVDNGRLLAEPAQSSSEAETGPAAVVAAVKDRVQPEIEKHLAERHAEVLGKLASSKRIPGAMKLPVRLKAMSDPWGAMIDLEHSGLKLASAARNGVGGVGEMLNRMSEAIGKPGALAGEGVGGAGGMLDHIAKAIDGPAAIAYDVRLPEGTGLEDQVEYAVAVLDLAKRLRSEALPRMSAGDRKALFAWSAILSENFSGQAVANDRSRPALQNDRILCELVYTKLDWARLVTSARCLAQLADRRYVDRIEQALAKAEPITEALEGVTGDVLYANQTSHGWILVGAPGANTYRLTTPVALIVDLGGDDTYQGTVAASFDHDHPNQIVIDSAGDDLYQGEPYTLGCGRLGVGMLFDLAGTDRYELAQGSGGTGFGGIGVLCDAAGHDTYVGSRHTQGAAIAGLGLLLDLEGDDQHTSFGRAIGFAGPAAAGALVDLEGDDSYQCGHEYRSSYNKSGAKPDDPSYQYTAFGVGTGLGRRVFSVRDKSRFYANEHCLAGGLGMVLDLAGDDSYDTSNFSQACGYFFGVGLKMDFAGNDRHGAARYGCSSGAHYGLGLFVDYAGGDTYQSTGPRYNGACAWDYSVFLAVEAGGDDTYQLERSEGPARADINSWSVFADVGGDDEYRLRQGLGVTTRTSLSAFFDQAGADKYQLTEKPEDFTPADQTTYLQDPGGLFVDE